MPSHNDTDPSSKISVTNPRFEGKAALGWYVSMVNRHSTGKYEGQNVARVTRPADASGENGHHTWVPVDELLASNEELDEKQLLAVMIGHAGVAQEITAPISTYELIEDLRTLCGTPNKVELFGLKETKVQLYDAITSLLENANMTREDRITLFSMATIVGTLTLLNGSEVASRLYDEFDKLPDFHESDEET